MFPFQVAQFGSAHIHARSVFYDKWELVNGSIAFFYSSDFNHLSQGNYISKLESGFYALNVRQNMCRELLKVRPKNFTDRSNERMVGWRYKKTKSDTLWCTHNKIKANKIKEHTHTQKPFIYTWTMKTVWPQVIIEQIVIFLRAKWKLVVSFFRFPCQTYIKKLCDIFFGMLLFFSSSSHRWSPSCVCVCACNKSQ